MLSLNRGFSAPIKLTSNVSAEDLKFLAARDSDPFNRWQAVQSLANTLLVDNVAAIRAGGTPRDDEGLIAALAAVLADTSLEPAFVALVLTMPSEADIARDIGRDVDPDAIFAARARLRATLGTRLGPALRETYRRMQDDGPVQPGRGERRTARAEECLPRPARRGGRLGDRACGAAVPSGDQHDRPHGGARDAVAAPGSGAPGRARRLLPALFGQSADHRQMAGAAGGDPGGRNARPGPRAHARIRRSRSPIPTACAR